MADEENVPGPPLKWYSAAVRYFVVGISMPAIFPITLPAFNREEAVRAAFRQFSDLAYDNENDVWRSPEGLPIIVWRVDVIEIPEPFSQVLFQELRAMMAAANAKQKRRKRRTPKTEGDNVVQLFPEKKDPTEGDDPPKTPGSDDPTPEST